MNAANKAPIDVGTVDVIKGASDVVLACGNVGADGRFRVEGVRPGRHRLRIRAIGYAPRDLSSVEMGSGSGVDLGTLELTAAAAELQSVVGTAPKQEVLLAPDRNTYAVRDMATTRGGNALDVLRNVPAVDVDIDNNVSVRGPRIRKGRAMRDGAAAIRPGDTPPTLIPRLYRMAEWRGKSRLRHSDENIVIRMRQQRRIPRRQRSIVKAMRKRSEARHLIARR